MTKPSSLDVRSLIALVRSLVSTTLALPHHPHYEYPCTLPSTLAFHRTDETDGQISLWLDRARKEQVIEDQDTLSKSTVSWLL